MSDWRLVECGDAPHVPCESELSAVITVTSHRLIRVDMMKGSDPIVSFRGYKVMRIIRCMEYWLGENEYNYTLSMSHAMYVGKEIQRAYDDGVRYEQD